MLLAITICATKSYTYAMRAQAQRVVANIQSAKVAPGHVIIVGDDSSELREAVRNYERFLPDGWHVTHIHNKGFVEGGENYKARAQLLIAAMRTEAFSAARKVGADFCWSLDSDVLPPPNALRCSLDMLAFDHGYYSVSTCPYANGLFLGGFGTYQNHIAKDFLPHERILPWHLKRAWASCETRLKAAGAAKDEAKLKREHKRRERLEKRIDACPPDGNIWDVIAKHGHRRRGWLDFAYPGIGKGSVVPGDWCGFGCTLMNREALALALFEGYDGGGTEDLFICWKRWHPAGLRLNIITHCPCDHVIWGKKKKDGDAKAYVHHIAYHEEEGEHRGHLRSRQMPWLRD